MNPNVNVIEEINETPAPNPNNIDTITAGFDNVAERYNELWLLTQYDMPADVISDGYADLFRVLNDLTRITQDRFTQHVRRTERLAREARGRARRERQTVAVQPAPVLPAPIQPAPIQPAPIQPAHIIPMLSPDHPPPGVVDHARRAGPRIVHKPKHTVRALKRSELVATLPDECAICIEKYTKSNSVETSCGHTFCKECYDVHEKTSLEKPVVNATVACPLCRVVNPRITEFRSRKTPVRRAPANNHEEPEVITIM
jgi:hypothetical protein